MIYITGDLHGEWPRLFHIAEEKHMQPNDYLIICGDCGLLFYDDDREQRVLNDIFRRFPGTLLFIDGNHENFSAFSRYPVENFCGGRAHRIRRNILHLMRGEVFTLENKRFFTFGGARSIDASLRIPNVSWWPEEMPSPEEYDRARETLKKYNYTVDYILTHEAPLRIAYMELARKTGSRFITPDPYAEPLQKFLDYKVLRRCTYKMWFCGHWHDDKLYPAYNLKVLWFDVEEIQ